MKTQDESYQHSQPAYWSRVEMFISGCQEMKMKPLSRLELETSPLPRECSTAELQGLVVDGPGWI